MNRITVWLAVGAAAALTSSCSTGHVLNTYGANVSPANVELECHQAYQVFDNRVYRTALVKPFVGSEVGYVACGAISSDVSLQSTSARVRRAMEKFLTDTGRPLCTVAGISHLGLTEYEASYTCPSTTPAARK